MTTDARPPLSAGYDVLVRSFGDVLYVRLELVRGAIELPCPCCNTWCLLETFKAKGCRWCGCSGEVVVDPQPGLGWVGLSAQYLLEDRSSSEFWLNGPWNPRADTYVEKYDLAERYNAFVKERDSHDFENRP